MTQPLAGWYPDPQAPSALVRWWDGAQWTAHTQRVFTGPTTDDGAPLAGWWQRVGAYLIDVAILGTALLPVQIPLQLRLHDRIQAVTDRFQEQAAAGRRPDIVGLYSDLFTAMKPMLVWVGLASVLLWAAYEFILLRRRGQTVGMMALSIKVRPASGDGRLSWGSIVRRFVGQFWTNLAYLLPVGPLLVLGLLVGGLYGLLDPVWAVWDRRNQTLHDKIGRTVVVRLR